MRILHRLSRIYFFCFTRIQFLLLSGGVNMFQEDSKKELAARILPAADYASHFNVYLSSHISDKQSQFHQFP